MDFETLKSRKRVKVYIDLLSEWRNASVKTVPLVKLQGEDFVDAGISVELTGKFSKGFSFEIHINSEDEFKKWEFK